MKSNIGKLEKIVMNLYAWRDENKLVEMGGLNIDISQKSDFDEKGYLLIQGCHLTLF